MIAEAEADTTLYVYPRPAAGVELDTALQKLNGGNPGKETYAGGSL